MSEIRALGIMHRPPRRPSEGLLAGGLLRQVVWAGLLMAGITLMTQAVAIHSETAHWQTMVFTVLTLAQMWQVMAIRSSHESLFRQGILSNRPLLGAVLLTFVLQLAVIYIPFLNPLFRTQPLGLAELAICVAVSGSVFAAIEIDKYRIRKRMRRG